MELAILEFVIALVGLGLTPLLFFRFPRLPARGSGEGPMPTVSVIIPARNEEDTLPLLLHDLRAQSFQPMEVICIDDDSSDLTAQIADAGGAKRISLRDKPDGWTGKTWACQNGAQRYNRPRVQRLLRLKQKQHSHPPDAGLCAAASTLQSLSMDENESNVRDARPKCRAMQP